MKRAAVGFVLLLAAAVLAGPAAAQEKSFTGESVEFTCDRPGSEEPLTIRATLPAGWIRNTAFGTAVFQPPDAEDYFDPPNIEFQAGSEGEVKSEAIPENIDGYIRRMKIGWKKLATGNAGLDEKGTIVTVYKEEKIPGRWVLDVKLTYPEGVSDAMYPPRHWIYVFYHEPKNPYFILVKGCVPVSLADTFLDDVRAACMSGVAD